MTMLHRKAGLFSALAAAAAAAMLMTAGCGGANGNSGGGDAPSVEAAGRFVPNYAGEITNLRRWPNASVTVRIVSPEAGDAVAAAEKTARVRKGMALWDEPTNRQIALEFTSDPNADITVTFVPSGSLNGTAVGETRVVYRAPAQVLVSATIAIDQSLDAETMTEVAAHELGHALGLEGHSSYPEDILYAHVHLPAQVTRRDANTLLANYGGAEAAGSRAVIGQGPETIQSATTSCGNQ